METINRKKRSANITNEQKTLLLEFMDKHPELVKGKFTSSFTVKTPTLLWIEISEILNSANGANKTWKEWRKVNIFIKFCIFLIIYIIIISMHIIH